MIAVDDIGAFAAMAFARLGHWDGRTVELAGDELSLAEVGAALGRMAGQEVRYQQMPWEEFEKRAGRDMAAMWRFFDNEGFHVDIPALRQELPNMATFERWLQANWTKHLTA